MADPYAASYARPYGDQSIAKSFAGLAQMFAPSSMQDQYAAARAAEVKQKMGGIAKLYELANDPNAAKNPSFDLYGAITGAWSPTSGFGARDMADTTKRRGQDIDDATQRYGIGVRSSDTRRGQDIQSGDTRRGQDIHSQDFRYKVGADSQTDITKTLLQPVQKDATRFIPPGVGELFQLPPMQSGVVAAQPGEKNYMPDGRVLEGGPKPMTETEMKAKIIGGLPQPQQNAIAFGSTPVETVVGPDGKRTTMSRPQMLETGTPETSKAPSQVYNWRTPDGLKGGTAVMREDGKLYDSQSGQELPAGVSVQGAGAAQGKDGALGPTTANATTSNQKAANLDAMQNLVNQYKVLLERNPGIVGPVGDVRAFAQNLQATLSELTAAAGPNAPIRADQVISIAQRIAPSRDPAIQQSRIMAADLAYKWAQAQNPSGEVSRQAFERALETLTGGALRNNISALEALGGVDQFIQRERGAVNSLRNPSATPGVNPSPAGPRVFQTPQGNVTIQRVE